jgi:hypothetical protein
VTAKGIPKKLSVPLLPSARPLELPESGVICRLELPPKRLESRVPSPGTTETAASFVKRTARVVGFIAVHLWGQEFGFG